MSFFLTKTGLPPYVFLRMLSNLFNIQINYVPTWNLNFSVFDALEEIFETLGKPHKCFFISLLENNSRLWFLYHKLGSAGKFFPVYGLRFKKLKHLTSIMVFDCVPTSPKFINKTHFVLFSKFINYLNEKNRSFMWNNCWNPTYLLSYMIEIS